MSARSADTPTLAAYVADALNRDPVLAERVDALRSRDEPLLDSPEVAERLGLTEDTVRAMARDGRLPAYPVGRKWRFVWSEVRAAVIAGRLG